MAVELSVTPGASADLVDGQEISGSLTDGGEASGSGQVQSMTLSVSDYSNITVSSIPVGALCGAIIMIIGFTFLGIVKIFKKV